jgi:hypothetical protein
MRISHLGVSNASTASLPAMRTGKGLDPELRERVLAAAETSLEVERGAFAPYLPDEPTLAGIAIPIQLLTPTKADPSSHRQPGGWRHSSESRPRARPAPISASSTIPSSWPRP